ncbi:MAG: DUF2461 domain-containing protein [Anaerotignaceae bacterium]
MKQKDSFTGFPKELTDFLWELRFNNNKEWFDKNRDKYKALLKDPMDSFAFDMSQMLAKSTGDLVTPAVSRMNRDIRFSKNKEPYRDHKWVVFKREEGTWKNKPAMFFELGPEYYTIGMGIYESLPAYMKAFRKKVDSNTAEFERLIKKYDKSDIFTLVGGVYKRKFSTDKSEEVINWYQRKSIVLICSRSIDELVYSRELLDFCHKQFQFLMPMMDYMMSVSLK